MGCKGENVGIGDEIERLYRIYLIVFELLNYLIKFVESYISLLDSMVKVLIRLEFNIECKEEIEIFVKKMENIKC